MVDWNSEKVISLCSFLFKQSLVLLVGMYGWEFVLSFRYVDFPLLTRRLKFRWMFIPYLFGRYGHLANLLALTIYLFTTTSVNCPVLGRLYSVIGTMTVACASTNMLIRTLTIWRGNRFIFCSLILFSLGHWVTALFTGFARNTSILDRGSGACRYDPQVLMLFYSYTVVQDFTVLVLTVVGLRRSGLLRSHSQPMWMAVYGQGVGYFLVTSLVNLPMLALARLDLNIIMTIITVNPAATISVICSSRAVIGLLNLRGELSRRPPEEFTSYRSRRPAGLDEELSCDASNPHPLTTNIDLNTMLDSVSVAGPSTIRETREDVDQAV